MVGRGARRARITAAFDALEMAVSAVRGAAERLHATASTAHDDARLEMVLRTGGIDVARDDPSLATALTDPRLAAVAEAVEADRVGVFEQWLSTAPDELAAILAEAAPAAAGADAQEWLGQVGKIDGSGSVPGLWRIGSAHIGVDAQRRAFGVGLPLLDEAHLQISSTHETRSVAEALVESLLMRVLSYFRPGMVALHVWDVGQFTGALPGLYPLTRTGLLTVHDPGRLPQLLEELSDRIRRVHTRVLVDGHASLKALARVAETRTEPWVVAVLVGNRTALREEDHRQLQRIARSGPACGVALVLLDVPMTVNAPVETVALTAEGAVTCSMTGPYAAVSLDPPPAREQITAACHALSEEHARWRTRIGSFRDLLPKPGRWGTTPSITGLHAPIGFAEGVEVQLTLADQSPHALVGGPSGSGKTNLLLAMISSLAARYDPDELEFYLLDFKEGVSFAQFAPGRLDKTWLPHARLIGVNINTDREFGLALLQFLADEMRRRAEAAKNHEVTKLEELRAADPSGRWPRIVAVVDEFQFLFAENDAVTKAAVALLEDVARRGRSQGIHLVLASQDVSGIEAFWGRRAIFEQFVLRIALPRARRVLDDLNDATLDLPRWHAVVNHDSGIRHGNEIVRIPDATVRGTVDEVQRVLHDDYQEGRARPRLFDGSRTPQVAELLAELPERPRPPEALVGQCIDVDGSAATVALPDVPGRNLGVLGSAAPDAVRVLAAAAGSLARQFHPGEVDVVLAPLVPDGAGPAAELAAVFAGKGHRVVTVALDGFRAQVDALSAEVTARLSGADRGTVFLVVHGADAADPVLGRPGTEALRHVLRFGPEVGVHVLGWWRSVARLKALLTMGASADDLGAFVGLDVQGAELGALAPGMVVNWAPRPGRGLFFDRAQHSRPQVVIVASSEVVS